MEHLITDAKNEGITCLRIAAAVIFDGKILLLKRGEGERTHPNFFVFPTAEFQEGESVNQLLQKALIINAGLTLDSVKGYLGHFDYDTTRQCNFLVTVKDPYSVQLSMHSAYAWVSFREAIGYPISAELREIIDRVIENIS